MARKFTALIFAALALAAPLATAQQPAPVAENLPQKKSDETDAGPRRRGPLSPEFRDVRRALEALTPEQRQRFVENFKRWASLPPEQRIALADRETLHRRRMAEDVDAAIKESGLVLEGERRALFEKRYGEERRKIEEGIRREVEEKRKPLVKDMIARLKQEFTSDAAPGPK